jgi:hypothetical protein
MRVLATLLLPLTLALTTACGAETRPDTVPASAPAAQAATGTASGEGQESARKVIRTADLGLEADDPAEARRKASELVEREGGFVATSEVTASEHQDRSSVALVLRVPADRFSAVLSSLRAMGTHVSRERVAGQDVTEEWVDLEGRLRTQRALEEQMLGILKDAKTVKDALDVQKELATVRGEIERIEGRTRLLRDRTSLATITLTVSPTRPVVAASAFGFGKAAHHAARDFVNVSAGIVTGGIRLAGWLLPVLLLIVLPLALLIRGIQRSRRSRALPA